MIEIYLKSVLPFLKYIYNVFYRLILTKLNSIYILRVSAHPE